MEKLDYDLEAVRPARFEVKAIYDGQIGEPPTFFPERAGALGPLPACDHLVCH
jgi:hypothetical protein